MMLVRYPAFIYLVTAISLCTTTIYADFSTIINVPPTTDVYSIGSDTQLNLYDGGWLRDQFSAHDFASTGNTEVNVYGGKAGYGFTAGQGSTVNVFGGELLGRVKAIDSSVVNISGGILNHGFDAYHGSQINLLGGEFLLNGQPIAGLNGTGDEVTVNWMPDSFLTGVLANGTPFLFTAPLDQFGWNSLRLKRVELPEIDASELVTSIDGVPVGVRSGQTLTIDSPADRIQVGSGSTIKQIEGGSSRFESFEATVNVHDGEARGEMFSGTVANVFGGELKGSLYKSATVNVHGGLFGAYVDGGQVNVFDGTVDSLRVYGGEVNFYGGTFYSGMLVDENSFVNFYGGVGGGFGASNSTVNFFDGDVAQLGSYEGGILNISGGRIRENLYLHDNSQVTLSGDQFLLDGQLINLAEVGDSIEIEVPTGSVISGILSDGNPFAFSAHDSVLRWTDGSRLTEGHIMLQKAMLPADDRIEIIASTDNVPLGLRQGQKLIVDSEAKVGDHFGAGSGSVVDIEEGGEIGRDFEAAGAQVNMRGGIISYEFDVSNGSVVEMTGGEIEAAMDVFGGGIVNVRSGKVGDEAYVAGTGVLNIYGGLVGKNLSAFEGGTINVAGGNIGDWFRIYKGSVANISGGTIEGVVDIYGTANISGGTFEGDIVAESGATVNVSGDAQLKSVTTVSGSLVDISGGTIESKFNVRHGSSIKIGGGNVDGRFTVDQTALVEMSGGVLTDGLFVDRNAKFTLRGGNFVLNGEPVQGLSSTGDTVQLDLPSSYSLEGVLADGTPFAFSSDDSDQFRADTLWLALEDIPVTQPKNIVASIDQVPSAMRGNQQITVDQGGLVANNFMMGTGSSMTVNPGGKVGNNLEVIGGTVDVRGGVVEENLDAFSGSVVNIESGVVGYGIAAHSGSTINISGGFAGTSDDNLPGFISSGRVLAKSGSEVNISGGEVGGVRGESGSTIHISGGRLGAYSQSLAAADITLSGGTIGDHFALGSGGRLTIKGTDFRIDGVPIAGLQDVGDSKQVTFDSFVAYSGTLQDGTPFALSHRDSDYIYSDTTFTLEHVAIAALGPSHITASTDPIPYGIRGGQTLVVDAGSVVGHSFNAGMGSVVEVQSNGTMGTNFEAMGATVNLNGGTIGGSSAAFSGAVINVNDGTLGDYFHAFQGSVVNVLGGSVGPLFSAYEGSTVNIEGGQISSVSVYPESTVNISGGTFHEDYKAFNRSSTYLFGTEFELDGLSLNDLQIGVPYEVEERDLTLAGVLASGTDFEFFLSDTYSYYWGDFFEQGAELFITLVHNPGDYNGDKRVNDADFLVWEAAMLTGDLAADGNYDRVVNETDRQVWQQRYGTSYSLVPEPSPLTLWGVSVLALTAAGRMRFRYDSR